MQFFLDERLFEQPTTQESLQLAYLLLEALLAPVSAPLVLVDPPYSSQGNKFVDAWLSQRDAAEARAFRTVLLNSSTAYGTLPRGTPKTDASPLVGWNFAGAHDVIVERRPATDWKNLRLTLTDALALLHEPVWLLLENARNDFAFLKHLCGANGSTLDQLEKAGRIRITAGGSGEVSAALKAFDATRDLDWRRVLRTWVLFDQDADQYDARNPSTGAVKLMDLCRNVNQQFSPIGLSWVCLRRREIESYVPDDGLRALASTSTAQRTMATQVINWRAGNSPNLQAYAWAFDLKKGLRGDLKEEPTTASRAIKEKRAATNQAIKSGQQKLTPSDLKVPFNTFSHRQVSDLESGFSDSTINSALSQVPAPGWTANIPAEYDRGPANQARRPELVQSLLDRI